MTQPPPARIGDDLRDVDTPALLIDLDAFESNIEAMAKTVSQHGVRLRAHSKTHKCPEIAKRQVAAGAIGAVGLARGNARLRVRGARRDRARAPGFVRWGARRRRAGGRGRSADDPARAVLPAGAARSDRRLRDARARRVGAPGGLHDLRADGGAGARAGARDRLG